MNESRPRFDDLTIFCAIWVLIVVGGFAAMAAVDGISERALTVIVFVLGGTLSLVVLGALVFWIGFALIVPLRTFFSGKRPDRDMQDALYAAWLLIAAIAIMLGVRALVDVGVL